MYYSNTSPHEIAHRLKLAAGHDRNVCITYSGATGSICRWPSLIFCPTVSLFHRPLHFTVRQLRGGVEREQYIHSVAIRKKCISLENTH